MIGQKMVRNDTFFDLLNHVNYIITDMTIVYRYFKFFYTAYSISILNISND
jgi:hypothetical protein